MRITKTIERWFDVPNDPDKARIKIRHLSPGERAEIFDVVFNQNISYKKNEEGGFDPVFSQDNNKKKDRELTLTKTVVGWEKFYDKKDKLLECNEKNIILASEKIDGFNILVTELREKLDEDIKQERKDQVKNLKGSVSK